MFLCLETFSLFLFSNFGIFLLDQLSVWLSVTSKIATETEGSSPACSYEKY